MVWPRSVIKWNSVVFVAPAERRLKRCPGSRHGLPLYPKQSFVAGAAAFVHKLDADEINITLRFGLTQYLPVPVISACHSPASGESIVKIRPQFNSVTSAFVEPCVITPPEGRVSLSVLPLSSAENVNVIRLVTESTGIVMA
jgi:hypothetical protein